MTRSGRIKKRRIEPDAIYNSELIQRFINRLMISGKKTKAEKIFYSAIKIANEKLKKDPLEIFEKVIENVRPMVEVKARRVGGSTYQVPVEVSRDRGLALAMQWLRDFSRIRSGRSMIEKLSFELVDAYNNTGLSIKKKEDVHKTAEANKAFAHFSW